MRNKFLVLSSLICCLIIWPIGASAAGGVGYSHTAPDVTGTVIRNAKEIGGHNRNSGRSDFSSYRVTKRADFKSHKWGFKSVQTPGLAKNWIGDCAFTMPAPGYTCRPKPGGGVIIEPQEGTASSVQTPGLAKNWVGDCAFTMPAPGYTCRPKPGGGVIIEPQEGTASSVQTPDLAKNWVGDCAFTTPAPGYTCRPKPGGGVIIEPQEGTVSSVQTPDLAKNWVGDCASAKSIQDDNCQVKPTRDRDVAIERVSQRLEQRVGTKKKRNDDWWIVDRISDRELWQLREDAIKQAEKTDSTLRDIEAFHDGEDFGVKYFTTPIFKAFHDAMKEPLRKMQRDRLEKQSDDANERATAAEAEQSRRQNEAREQEQRAVARRERRDQEMLREMKRDSQPVEVPAEHRPARNKVIENTG